MRDDDRVRADAFSGRLWLYTPRCIELFRQESVGRCVFFDFCGSFRVLLTSLTLKVQSSREEEC